MSNHVNEQILEKLFDEVSEMNTGSILRELEGGMKPGLCDSFDERVALTDRDKVIEKLVNKRFEELPEGPQ
jgi:hypothetical protein